MDYLIALVSSGLVVGAVYGLLAMGFAVIYKATGLINFAHGEVMMIIAYLSFTIAATTGLGFLPVLLLTVAVSVAVGLVVEVLFIRPMLGEPAFTTVMITIGLAVMLRSAVTLIWGADPHPFPSSLPEEVIALGPVRLYPAQLILVGLLLLAIAGFHLFFRHSRAGVAMRATANRETTALLMGIDVRRVYALAWALSAATAGVAGLMVASIYSVAPDLFGQGLRAFPAAILGGLDSVLGAAAGGLIIGVIENLAEGYIGHGLKEIVGFVVIILVLMVRPYGLFGQKRVERV